MAEVFRTTRRVEFRETDAAGIAHFSAFLCYMEQAEHDLLRTLDWSVMIPHEETGYLSWPRVHVECDFQGTVQFEDVLDIAVDITLGRPQCDVPLWLHLQRSADCQR